MVAMMRECPKCGETDCWLLSTDNEWLYMCAKCQCRFNEEGEVHPAYREKGEDHADEKG